MSNCTPITEELQSYLEMVIQEEAEDMLYEMANLGDDFHGIPNIVLWLGKTNKQHGLRIKVSNKKNAFDFNDNFVIRIPSLDYDPTRVANWINAKTMRMILDWIKLNQQVLYDVENSDTMHTNQLIALLSKV